VLPGSTFYDFVRCMVCRGIINGYPCGGPGEPCNANGDPYFRPGNNVTRGQIAKIVSNSAGFNDPPSGQLFQDVPPGHTFYDFVQRLASRDVMQGYPCGGPGEPCIGPNNLPYFRPNGTASRGQLAKIDSNAANFQDPASGQAFQDVPPGHTFYDFVQRLAARDIMQGYPCGGPGEPCIEPNRLPYFRPADSVSRGQTSKIVANTFFPNCYTPSR
jgi:S-layer homology domain